MVSCDMIGYGGLVICYFFCFKQKTAYEMRISDWSSDGCSSDLDEFRFVLTREEYLDMFLDDLELPDLAKRQITKTENEGVRRAGYTTSGSPASLSITRTMRNSLSRRIALKRPSSSELEALEAEIARQEELEDRDRTEEKPSELQSIMPNSNAVY